MGTETSLPDCLLIDMISTLVKLNNPLMGTETKIDIDILQLYGIHLVKLNDPLMGTETINSLLNR